VRKRLEFLDQKKSRILDPRKAPGRERITKEKNHRDKHENKKPRREHGITHPEAKKRESWDRLPFHPGNMDDRCMLSRSSHAKKSEVEKTSALYRYNEENASFKKRNYAIKQNTLPTISSIQHTHSYTGYITKNESHLFCLFL
jgi:hypothetical protein